MSASYHSVPTPTQFLRAMLRRPLYWAVPAVLCAIVATGYAVLRTPEWQATQALLVRTEASQERPGRFDNSEQLKNLQGTVIEMVRSRAVVEAAMKQVGPPADTSHPSLWPTAEDIETQQSHIAVKAPNGAELGTTEVFYLQVQDPNRARAVAMAEALCNTLDAHLQELRERRAASLIDELTRIVAVAQADLDQATARLQSVESSVGADLPELRILSDANYGNGSLTGTISTIEAELRSAEAERNSRQELLELLEAARQDPAALVATPSELLSSQPALSRLKDGLVDAQLRTAQLSGTMSPEHPEVKSAIMAEQEIRQHLHQELGVAIRGLQAELRLADNRVAELERKRSEAVARLESLAGRRSQYANLVAEARSKSEILERAQENLADARASQAAAKAASQLTRLDGPVAGANPEGPRKAYIVLAGFFAGLVLGAGIVFLTMPVEEVSASTAAARAKQPMSERRTAHGESLWKQWWAHLTGKVPAHQ